MVSHSRNTLVHSNPIRHRQKWGGQNVGLLQEMMGEGIAYLAAPNADDDWRDILLR